MTRPMGNTGTAAAHQVAGWVPPLARLGYAAKGVVYALIGGIAIKAEFASGEAEGSTGALASLVDEQGGRLMLLLIAAGLLCHVLWRMVQAVLDPEHRKTGANRIAMRAFYAMSAVIYASLAFTAWQLGRGDGEGSQNGKEVWIARLLEQPFGTLLVMLVGIGVMAYGLHQIYKGLRGDVNRRMGTGGVGAVGAGTVGAGTVGVNTSRGVTLIGRVGTAARGLVLLPIGWFVFNAGREYRAAEAADTGEVLKIFEANGLLAAIGIGLLAYGLHQIAKAVYRRIERPG